MPGVSLKLLSNKALFIEKKYDMNPAKHIGMNRSFQGTGKPIPVIASK
jgi:hypothetical protein